MNFRLLLLLFLLIPAAALAQDDTPPFEVMALILDDINQRFDEEYTLATPLLEWDWTEVTWSDMTADCRPLSTPYEPFRGTGYEITVRTPNSGTLNYHTTIAGEIILACGDEIPGMEGVPRVVTDALADLNTRVGLRLDATQVRWTYTERLFDDWSLGCPLADVAYPNIDVNGYEVTFELLGEEWDYRVSADRQIMFLCNPRREEPDAAATEEPTATEETDTTVTEDPTS
ncbi:MAG: hypothetical protein AAGK74_16850 [Chloroflexota bacterium]